jgi:radical SAM-linked protein
MARRTPDGPAPPPVVQRVRLRYAKRGPLRFASHRDFARAFERAVRRAGVPVAYSAGFSPHPKISYAGAAPTGVASDAEYLEVGLAARVDPAELRSRLDAALPQGLTVLDAVEAGAGSLADRLTASRWRLDFTDVPAADLERLVAAFLARSELLVQRLTKDGRRMVDARAAVVAASVAGHPDAPRAILDVVARRVTPAVRPDDMIAALRIVAGLAHDAPPWSYQALRVAQGPLDASGAVGDPLAAEHSEREPS